MAPNRRSRPSDDEVEQALIQLHEHPLGDESLGLLGQHRQNKAADVILSAFYDRLLKLCRRYGLDVETARDVIYPELQKFLMRDVAKVSPVVKQAIGWMDRTCSNAVISLLRKTSPLVPLETEHEEVPDPNTISGNALERAEALSTAPPTSTEHAATEADYLDVALPAGVTHHHWMQALDQLARSDRALFDLMLRRLDADRQESSSPREFDRKSYRLPATRVAQILGRTENSVSVQWARIQKTLRRAVSVLRVRELQDGGHTLTTIRTMLKRLGWSEPQAESLMSELGLPSSKASGGLQ